MKDERLEQLEAEARVLVEAMRDRMRVLFPEGSRWKVRLRDNQKNPTIMTVNYVCWDLTAKVDFVMPRPGCKIGRVLRRVVPLRRIVGPAD